MQAQSKLKTCNAQHNCDLDGNVCQWWQRSGAGVVVVGVDLYDTIAYQRRPWLANDARC